MMLVTLAQAKKHINVDFDEDDEHITLLVHAASAAVNNYLKDAIDVYMDSNDEPIVDLNDNIVGVPYEVKAATLLMVGYLFRMRDNNEGGEFQMGYLPAPVTALLYPLRDPGYA